MRKILIKRFSRNAFGWSNFLNGFPSISFLLLVFAFSFFSFFFGFQILFSSFPKRTEKKI